MKISNFSKNQINNKKIEKVDDIITILKIIEIKSDENKLKYIDLLIEKFSNFKDEDITEESFINLLEKTDQYAKEKKIELLKLLYKFGNHHQIYSKIFVIYSNDNNILNSLATESSTNLEINEFIELVKSLNEEKREPKKLFFDKLKERLITYKDFFEENEEDLKNLILLIELMKNQLIPDSEYLEKTKVILIDLYDNLSK